MIRDSKDFITYAAEVVGKDPFASLLGIKVEEVRNSYARVSLKISEEFCNAETRAHGGILFALADQAFAVAAHSSGVKMFGIEMKINYLQAALPGEVLTAVATPIDIRKRVSLWNVDVTNSRGQRVAVAQGLAYHIASSSP